MLRDFQEMSNFCEEKKIKMIDFKVSDLTGRWHHLTIPASRLSESIFEDGIGFDGSSYGFLTVEKSDMIFKPDITTAFYDRFCETPTLSMIGNIYVLGETTERYEGDPRYICEKAQEYLKETRIADENIIGPEFEFYLLDHVSYINKPNHMEMVLDANQAQWNMGNNDYQNLGYKVLNQKGYHAALPYDINFELRNKMTLALEEAGIKVKYHHHEVGGPGQLEIEVEPGGLLEMGDKTLLLKYIIKNMAIENGKTATFMPKPLYGHAGSGMHVHMWLFNEGEPVFYDENGYSSLSKEALYFIGGLLKHAPSLLAFTNPSTNSYKRLVPGFEAPVCIGYATGNRSSVIRIPAYAKKPEKKRFEFRSSDATCNPYLAYSALLMAGLDGIENEIDPQVEGFGPYDMNMYNLSEEEKENVKFLPKNLDEAADSLEKDYEYLLKGGVFTKELVLSQLNKIRKESMMVNQVPHPEEFKLYFDL